jgi:hypothetical protein
VALVAAVAAMVVLDQEALETHLLFLHRKEITVDHPTVRHNDQPVVVADQVKLGTLEVRNHREVGLELVQRHKVETVLPRQFLAVA